MGKGGQQQGLLGDAKASSTTAATTTTTESGVDVHGLSKLSETPVSPKPNQQTDAHWSVLESAEREGERPLEMSDFTIIRKLGTGSSATVYLVRLRDEVKADAMFALKVFHKDEYGRKNRVRRIITEHSILCSTDHPFVVTLYRTFFEKGSVGFLMEYCRHGDMYQYLQRQPLGRFPEHQVRVYAAQVLIALQYMHMQGYVYRDLKPENILLCSDGHIKLTDFDLSRAVDPPMLSVQHPMTSSSRGLGFGLRKSKSEMNIHVMAKSLANTSSSFNSSSSNGGNAGEVRRASSARGDSGAKKGKMARSKSGLNRANGLKMVHSSSSNNLVHHPRLVGVPKMRSTSFVGTDEYIAPEVITCRGYSSSVDWWSLGIFVYELSYGRTPFASKNRNTCFKKIVEEDLSFPALPDTVSATCKDLMRSLLIKEPSERLGGLQGASEIKAHPFFSSTRWALLRN
jgi:serine/threonine protein kinase